MGKVIKLFSTDVSVSFITNILVYTKIEMVYANSVGAHCRDNCYM